MSPCQWSAWNSAGKPLKAADWSLRALADRKPADFLVPVADNPPSENVCDQLCAKADPQHNFISLLWPLR